LSTRMFIRFAVGAPAQGSGARRSSTAPRTLIFWPSCVTIYATREMTAIAILGEYTPAFAPHAATTAAIAHARARLGVTVDAEWMSTAAVDETLFERVDALWIAPGSPYKDLEQTLWAIREARVIALPGHPFFIGTLFVPQARSTPERPHPLVTAFVAAAAATRK